MNRVMTDMGSALAPVVGKIRVRASIPTRWILPGHLHLPERFWKRTLPGRLLVCVPLIRMSPATTHIVTQAQRCSHDIQVGLKSPSVSLGNRDQVLSVLCSWRWKLELTFRNTQCTF